MNADYTCRACIWSSPSRRPVSRVTSAVSAPSTESIFWFPPAASTGSLAQRRGQVDDDQVSHRALAADCRQHADSRHQPARRSRERQAPHRRRAGGSRAVRSPDGAGNAHLRCAGARDRCRNGQTPCVGSPGPDGAEQRGDDAGHRLLARDAQEAVTRSRAAAGAEAALPRRAVRGDRRGGVAADQGSAVVVRLARRHDLSHVAHSGDRRAAVDPHRRDRRRQDGRAGSDRRSSHRRGQRQVARGALHRPRGRRRARALRCSTGSDRCCGSFARSCGCAGACC